MTYTTDNRFSPGASGTTDETALAAYSARWIDQGSALADVVPDRQGFAYNDQGNRTRLIDRLVQHDTRLRTTDDLAFDQTDTFTVDGVTVSRRRAGGYVYVDAYLKGTS